MKKSSGHSGIICFEILIYKKNYYLDCKSIFIWVRNCKLRTATLSGFAVKFANSDIIWARNKICEQRRYLDWQ